MADDYRDPFDETSKTMVPLPQSRWHAVDRRRKSNPVVAVGPIQAAVTVATSKYNYYREIYEEEKDRGHINTEIRRRTELYGKMSKDLNTLLRILREETQNVFLKSIKPQRVKIARKRQKHKKSTILRRAIRMVAR